MLTRLEEDMTVTIPEEIVEALGLEDGDLFDIRIRNGAILLQPVRDAAASDVAVPPLFVSVPEPVDSLVRSQARTLDIFCDAFVASVLASSFLGGPVALDPSLLETLRIYTNPYLADKLMNGMVEIETTGGTVRDLIDE